MDRRTLLKLTAAVSVAGCSGQPTSGEKLRVVIAGAGIIGASIAYHLAKAGASVTVIDRESPASHASRGTFAWINATWAKQPQYYHRLAQDSVANWKDLQPILGLPIRWGGSLEWFSNAERQQKLDLQIAEQKQWGEAARMIDAGEMATLEPNINFGGAGRAAFSGNDGAVDPVVATRLMLQAAQDMGAMVKYPCELLETKLRAGRLMEVNTSLGPIQADRLVLATGADPLATRQFADIDIPQRSTPGVIAITAPMPRLLNRILVAPGIHMHQRDDGRFVLGEQGGAPGNSAHAMRLEGRPNSFPEPVFAAQHAARMLAVAKQYLPDITDSIEHVYIGWRPLPIDGHPVLGASPVRPDVYMAIMHSGVSLAPIVGQLVSHELTLGSGIDRLDEFRPGRIFQKIKRY